MIKTHNFGLKCQPEFDKAILLIRHPMGAIVSEYNRQSGAGHKGKAHPALFYHASKY